MQVYNMRQYYAPYLVSEHAIIQFQKRIAKTLEFKEAERQLLDALPALEELHKFRVTGPDPNEYEIHCKRWGTFTAIIRQPAECRTATVSLLVVTIYRNLAKGYSAECTVCGKWYKKDFRTGMEHRRPICSSKCNYRFKQGRRGKYRPWGK